MAFARTEEQQAIYDITLAFGADKIAPFAAESGVDGTIPRGVLEAAGHLGFGGIYVSGDHGGAGLGRLDAAMIFEALSHACPSVAAFTSIHTMSAWMLDRYGSEELKLPLLPDLCALKKVASYCPAEPASGSDAAALRARAARDHARAAWRLLDGIRVAVIDRDRKPRWRHADIQSVAADLVDLRLSAADGGDLNFMLEEG